MTITMHQTIDVSLHPYNIPRNGTLLFNINSYTQFEENRSKNAKEREWKQISNVNQGL